MTNFSKICFCTKNQIKFRSEADWDENAIDKVYCPLCSDRAPDEALMVQVTGVPKRVGIYGINFNQAVLKQRDVDFADAEAYYADLISSEKLVFDFFPRKMKKPEDVYSVLGLKGVSSVGSESLSGPDALMARRDGKPVKLPKKTRSSSEESYFPQSGYKGHK